MTDNRRTKLPTDIDDGKNGKEISCRGEVEAYSLKIRCNQKTYRNIESVDNWKPIEYVDQFATTAIQWIKK